jgi:hypothetical protein
MDELQEWLKSQHKGLRTYKTFHQRVLDLGLEQKRDYVLCHLLAVLVERFIDSYEENPLSIEVADAAHKKLVELTEKAAKFGDMPCEQRLQLLDEVARSHLH